jgi:Lrp/AsnC family transcriptional regulator, leucine-responsive regulatory protein
LEANISLDAIDAGIITALSKDSRRSYADVGLEVGLSTAAVHERVKKLIERGVIEKFSLKVDPLKVGLTFTAFVSVRNDGTAQCRDIARLMRAIPEVIELHSVAGDYDLLAKIRTTHARALEDILYQLKAIPGILKTNTTVVLSTEFET